MAARNALKALVAAVVGALLRSSAQQERARPPRASHSTSNDSRGDGSPGQYGPGATRELSAPEIATLAPVYEPDPDGDPDPGEIVWTWVPYAENDGRGKDRPVLIVARTPDGAVAGCYLSTKQHRGFISVGTGPWDSQGRESFLSPERVLRVTESGMRREGHVLERGRFVRAVTALERLHRMRSIQ